MSKDWANRLPEDKGARCVRYFAHWSQAPRIENERRKIPPCGRWFGWMTPRAWVWRELVKRVYIVLDSKGMKIAEENIKRIMGAKWAWKMGRLFESVRFEVGDWQDEAVRVAIEEHNLKVQIRWLGGGGNPARSCWCHITEVTLNHPRPSPEWKRQMDDLQLAKDCEAEIYKRLKIMTKRQKADLERQRLLAEVADLFARFMVLLFETCPNDIFPINNYHMHQSARRVLFFLFFLSGFSSLVYQVIWTRLAFAAFGIITPVLSIVLSVFMLGLAIGSWGGGQFVSTFVRKSGLSAAMFYALAEFLVGLGAFVVPKLFEIGERILLASGETDSFGYLLLSALALAVSILPWCICMGTTFPFMMAYIREQDSSNEESFSFLYLANVLGAMTGTFMAAVVLIELCGFHHTLWIAATSNFTIVFISICLGWKQQKIARLAAKPKTSTPFMAVTLLQGETLKVGMMKWILFSTGFIAMAMEVVWTRAFIPVLKTQVYSFAMIVFTYLGATFVGSWAYRRDLRRKKPVSVASVMAAVALVAFLPVLANDSRLVVANWMDDIDLLSVIILLVSICPVCALLGYLTPGLVDAYAGGQPAKAGRAYGINVLGCILGPLFACYVLLPHLSERYALILLAAPFLGFYFLLYNTRSRSLHLVWSLLAAVVLVSSLFFVVDFEAMLLRSQKHVTIRRDYTASVISMEAAGDKRLLVNGIGMTTLTPITKFIVHLPLAFHQGQPKSALVICFGMGTTFRSALSWNIDTTAVELVPSVTKAFGFYHSDAELVTSNPNGHIITDDGRRFLRRTDKKYDVIVVDPPPPVQAAGSSLLFSKEFYDLAKQHLNPEGIVQMWFPGDREKTTAQAVVRSIHESFPYVRCFPSVAGWGLHLLASMNPIDQLNADQLAARMPENAQKDLLEWNASKDTAGYIAQVITNECSLQLLLNPNPAIEVSDDKPFNEYFLLRHLQQYWNDSTTHSPK